MHMDNHDFYGHPHRPRLNHTVIGFGLLVVFLTAAYAWSQSSYADQYRAQKLAQAEAERMGLNVEPLAPVARKKECSYYPTNKSGGVE